MAALSPPPFFALTAQIQFWSSDFITWVSLLIKVNVCHGCPLTPSFLCSHSPNSILVLRLHHLGLIADKSKCLPWLPSHPLLSLLSQPKFNSGPQTSSPSPVFKPDDTRGTQVHSPHSPSQSQPLL